MAIRTQGTTVSYSSHKELSNWLTFSERDHGYISGFDKPFKKYPNFPSLTDTFTLESGMFAWVTCRSCLSSFF